MEAAISAQDVSQLVVGVAVLLSGEEAIVELVVSLSLMKFEDLRIIDPNTLRPKIVWVGTLSFFEFELGGALGLQEQLDEVRVRAAGESDGISVLATLVSNIRSVVALVRELLQVNPRKVLELAPGNRHLHNLSIPKLAIVIWQLVRKQPRLMVTNLHIGCLTLAASVSCDGRQLRITPLEDILLRLVELVLDVPEAADTKIHGNICFILFWWLRGLGMVFVVDWFGVIFGSLVLFVCFILILMRLRVVFAIRNIFLA